MKKTTILLAALSASFLAGCATNPTYGDPNEVRTYSTRFTHSDYEQTAAAMVDSLKSNPNFLANIEDFKAANPGQRPKIFVSSVKNDTRDITLKVDVITDAIKTGVVNTGLFRFVGNEQAVTARKFDEANGVLVAPGASSGFSNQTGADYVLTGTITQLDDEGGRTREKVYILAMQLDNLRTGEIDWMDRKPIRKYSQRAGFGF